MSSDQLIALATDALRGLLQAAVPAEATVIVGAPSVDGQPVSGLFVQLLRVAVDPAVRNLPTPVGPGMRASPPLGLQLDYLIGGLGGEALAELGLLDAALQVMLEQPWRNRESVADVLSQPERLVALSPAALELRWTLLDLSLEQVAGVWVGCGMRQRGGVFVRGVVSCGLG